MSEDKQPFSRRILVGGSSPPYLAEETETMEHARRQIEQQGHRKWARVQEHRLREMPQSAGEEPGPSMQQHPWLNQQRFDGIANNLNPEPSLNSEARREFDNSRREQEKEKQLRLGNMPQFSTAPKPRP